MDFYSSQVWEAAVVFAGLIGIVVPSVGIVLGTSFKRRKMEEEHRTNNLALAYQILASRPEVTMNDVKELISVSGSPELKGIEDKSRIK